MSQHPMSARARVFGAAMLCALFALSACTPKKTVKKTMTPEEEAALAAARNGGTESVTLPSSADVEEARIRGKEFAVAPELQPIRFDFDAYSVADEARAAIRANADYIKQHPDLEVLVEGHCDERGTTEYNLALGQKRAKAVREYYIRLGVPGGKVATISFGEERPSCGDSDESCWGLNRRAETKIRAQVSSAPYNSGSSVVR